MTAAAFDTHAAVKRLQAAGFSEQQAEAQTALLAEALTGGIAELATKTDVEMLHRAIQADLNQLRLETKADLAQMRSEIKADIADLKADILKWVIGLLLAQTAVIAALVKLL
jgi:flagellar biosynthesis/type III secretory pathway protein FliH